MPRRFGLLLSLALSFSCEGADPALIVHLKTDLVPGLQFVGVRTTVRDGSRTAEELEAIETEERVATQGEDYLIGQRVAELAGVPQGLLAVEVALLGVGGEVIAARQTLVEVRANRSITVLLTGSCAGVTCPGTGDDPTYSSCVGGRCVDPRCTPESPEFCGTPGCLDASHCTSPVVECAEPRCIDRECFVAVDDDRCAPTEECHPTSGCVVRAGVDAGPECPATETSCVDGVDDDCDGDVDCADADCADQSCDDGSICTEVDTCQPDGTCGGPEIDCDDDNPCTTDACAPEFGCTHALNTAPCDDGYWCNGADTCRDGACQDHADPPCASFCNETTMSCEQCTADADCGAPVAGAWGACGGFGGACDESGTQTRAVMTPRCQVGVCVVETTSETQACPRDTENDTCGTTTYSGWSNCGSFGGPCDETGTRTRTRTRRLCRSGSCTNVNNQESDGCTRSRPNGTPCGGFWDVCCSGACRSVTTNTRCGACGVDCSAIAESCTRDGATGGYSCSGCATNAECRSILNSAATCYTSGSSRCNCQCPANGVCRGGGCGANFYCHDCSGHNFCSPHGGSC